jgi:hypothetical protein
MLDSDGVTLTGVYPCFSLPTPSELYQVIRSPGKIGARLLVSA